MPFAGYKDFADCVKKNKDKRSPERYCGYIKHKVEDKKCARCGQKFSLNNMFIFRVPEDS